MSTEKRDFDKEAASWYENPARVKLADDVIHAISEQIVLTPEMNIMDFGRCAGRLSLRLQPLVSSVTGIDSSKGMLEILNAKIAKLKLKNAKTMLIDLDKGDLLTGNYDLCCKQYDPSPYKSDTTPSGSVLQGNSHRRPSVHF
jgi:2-polyprenyl-3-methyl-5-hydroxy-6-metoxy-1,4-benzoquinol methylase